MNDRTFIFRNVNAKDYFGLVIDSAVMNPPEKIEHKKQLPYSNITYNFDKIIGFPTYTERTITYTCQIIERDSEALNDVLSRIETWLMTTVESILKDTALPQWHFVGTCTGFSSAIDYDFAEVTIQFTVYPFKINNNSESQILWDTFNFEYDYLTQTSFTLRSGTVVKLNNRSACPVELNYSVDKNTTVTYAGKTYNLTTSGSVASFLLKPDENVITVTSVTGGEAEAEFDWVREVL